MAMEGFTAPFTVLRLLTPLKMSYEAAKKRAEPYAKIVEVLPEMMRDTVELVKKAVGQKRKTYVLVNNRSEGNAPLTFKPCGTRCKPPRHYRWLFSLWFVTKIRICPPWRYPRVSSHLSRFLR